MASITSFQFRCKICEAEFATSRKLENHRKNVHEVKKTYACKFCKKVFNYPTNRRQHERTHTGYKPYPCPHCEMTFNQKTLLNNHLFSKHGLKSKVPYTCLICKDKEKPENDSESKSDFEFTYAKAWRRHMVTCHPEVALDKEEDSSKSLTLCKFCWKTFENTQELEDHIVDIHEKHKCTMCSKQFLSASHLKEHILVHVDIKPYSCEYCGSGSDDRIKKSFYRKRDLRKHLIKYHQIDPEGKIR